MKRFALALALAALALSATTALAEKIPLADISAYFNSFRTAEARFTQFNDDGTSSTGTLMIQRPGRMRFEYDPPVGALVLAAGGQVAIFDDKSNVAPEQYPLSRTPLSIILEDTVDLGRARMVVDHIDDGTTTSVIAQDPENPDAGTIRLFFSDDPVQLRQWVITDQAGGRTVVVLDQLRTGMDMPSSQFNIPIEIQRRQR